MIILSGGQTGVDQAGLRAARAFSIPTGGWAPCGWRTENGSAPWLKYFGLVQSPDWRYRDRTARNVARTDAVLWLGNPGSPGGRLTLGLAHNLLRRVVPRGGSPPQESATWLCRVLIDDPGAHILIAGNRESSSPGIGRWAEEYLLEMFARALEV